ncbi:hypothetical protein ABZ901_00465 [Actinacidiphila alni]|uniref:hypothetical protein n=1 Tax=Actinacidiphila alni TaxID=380248 RepID=UPI0033DA21DE
MPGGRWSLVFAGRAFVNFRDHTFADPGGHAFRWADVKTFRLSPAAPDAGLLDLLVAADEFRDDYAGGGIDPAGLRHGPYWLRHVTADAYEPVTGTAAVRTLRRWADQYGPLPATLEQALHQHVFAALTAAPRCFALRDLGRSAFHDWGGVHTAFHEYAAIDRDRSRLTLIVAADD